MGNCRSVVIFCAVGALINCAQAQFTDVENQFIRDTLRISNLTDEDLRWSREPYSDDFRLPLISDALQNPISGASRIDKLEATLANTSVSQSLRLLSDTLEQGLELPPESKPLAIKELGLPEPYASLVTPVLKQISVASQEVRASLGELSDAERRSLIESLPALMMEEFNPGFDFVNSKPIPRDDAFGLLRKIDLKRIFRAGIALNNAVETLVAQLKVLNTSGAKFPMVAKVAGQTVRITGPGRDVHSEKDAVLTIDMGGDDVYTGRAGGGAGYASVQVDINGDDRYTPSDLSIGAGLLGIGIAWDCAGDDIYSNKSIGLGCGIAGIGILVDQAGDDSYKSHCLAQGFGAFGAGLLIDSSGSDTYDIHLTGQGAARTLGFGVLSDRKGRDIYRAGGTALNSPLFADVNYSFAQGFGMGYREDTGGVSGGVGFLLDLAGDDAYLAETYAQGASYWFAIGGLWDGGGHDTYSAYHYAQASAMHCTAAYLTDNGGDDAYVTKFGASLAIGHDYGVAALIDRSGNDIYTARDSTPGVGNANGIGMFFDFGGDDRYQGPAGVGNAARSSGSLGIFLDASGQDKYREGLVDASATVTELWGVAYDAETPRIQAPRPVDSPDVPKPNSQPMPDEKTIAEIYRLACQWGVGTAQQEVNLNTNKLIAIGIPAVKWMLDNRLAKADRLQQRAFVAVIKAVGHDAAEALAFKIARGTTAEQRNGLGIAVDGAFMEVASIVPPLIDNPSVSLQAIRAAGVLKSSVSVDRLMPLTRKDGTTGLAAMISLAQIGDERAFGTAQAFLTAKSLPMRKAALSLVAQFPEKAMQAGTQLLLESDERAARIGMEVLGAVGTAEALEQVAGRLLDPSPGYRMQALITLKGRCPENFRLTYVSLRNDPDPMVRAVAQRSDPGR